MKQLTLILTLSSVLTGCALFSPEYQQPAIAAPSQTRTGVIFESNSTDFSQLQWWKKFQNPLLNSLIIQALKNNNELKMAQGNILQAQAQLKSAEYAWIPTLSASGMGLAGNTYMTNMTPQGSLARALPAGSVGNTNFNVWEGGFVPSYTFNVFANLNQTKLAQASLEMQQAAFNATRLSIISQVSGGYFMLLGQKQQLLLQRQLLADLDKLSQLQQLKITVGTADQTNLKLLQQQYQDANAKIPQIENSIAATENALKVLLGENPGKINSSEYLEHYDLNGIIPTNLPSAILKNRPDILLAEDNLKMANANVGLANSVFFPTISLTGNIGGASVALSNLFSVGTGFWFMQAAANMPILNASSYEQIKAAKGGYYVAYYNYVQTIKAAFADVDNSLTNQQKMDAAYAASKKSYQALAEYYHLIETKYRVGTADKLTALNARLLLDNSALNLNSAKMQQLNSIVGVYQSLAGGYAVNESSTAVTNAIDN